MTVEPFTEAEKQSNHNVKRACELLKVSRTAFYARLNGVPGPRAVRDLELTGKIAEAHEYSRGTYRYLPADADHGAHGGTRPGAGLRDERGVPMPEAVPIHPHRHGSGRKLPPPHHAADQVQTAILQPEPTTCSSTCATPPVPS